MKSEPEDEAAGALPAVIVHTTQHRLRLSIERLKGNREALGRICDKIIEIPGVEAVDARPLTGSVIISHTGHGDEILTAAQRASLIRVFREPEASPEAEVEALRIHADRAVRSLTDSGVSLRAAIAVLFLLMAVRQLWAGNLMPPAATALWYGLSLLTDHKENPMPESE